MNIYTKIENKNNRETNSPVVLYIVMYIVVQFPREQFASNY